MPPIRGYPAEQRSMLSPYLIQHADNPVDWWEWSDEAFAEARRRDVPVFLSSGYSSCHWCHVMAHESFEDPALAEVLNDNFVSIKVDREERPDVDAVYMAALQAMTGHGGWPMSVFLDHDRRPFFAGTYYPNSARPGMAAFGDVLKAIAEAWRDQRSQVTGTGSRIVAALADRLRVEAAGEVAPGMLQQAESRLAANYDSRAGGFGGAPKFPPTSVIEFLLRRAIAGDPVALGLADHTCEAMARGGMYDQVGGGFARYSVDADWVVPHFEKMLYDNALLLRNYAHLHVVTGSELAARVARETAEFLIRELQLPEGGFASSLDADSGGEEGSFYVWTRAELTEALGDADGEWVADLCDVTYEGTFERGRSVLQLRSDPDDWERWQGARGRLFDVRERRVRPARDDSVVTAWNGLAIGALARAGAMLEEPRFIAAGVAAAELMVSVHLRPSELARTSRRGVATKADGVLEDHAGLAAGLLDLYSVTGDTQWYLGAERVIELMLRGFSRGDGGFRDARSRPGELVLELTDATDLATPSGASMAADVLVTYSTLSGRYVDRAAQAVAAACGTASESPRFGGWALAAATTWLDGSPGVALVGSETQEGWSAMRAEGVRSLVAGYAFAAGDNTAGTPVAFLAERGPGGPEPAAFLCRNATCQLPVHTAEELTALVGAPPTGAE